MEPKGDYGHEESFQKHDGGFKRQEEDTNPEAILAQGSTQQLERGLKSRHIQFLALGAHYFCFTRFSILTSVELSTNNDQVVQSALASLWVPAASSRIAVLLPSSWATSQ